MRRSETPQRPAPHSARARASPAAWTSALAGAAAFALFVRWAPHAAAGGDSSELTLVLATRGLAHPTGYSLYTLVGHEWVTALHAAGADWAWAANLWSALGGAIAIALLHAFAARMLCEAGITRRSAALLAALPVALLALDPAFNAEATSAEVNSWHLAWVAGACLLAANIARGLPEQGNDGRAIGRRMLLWSLVVGLGVSHHATSVLIALPLTAALLAVLRATHRLQVSWLASAAAGLLVPPLAWTYVAFRAWHPAAMQWGSLEPSWVSVWQHVTAAGYRHFLGSFAPAAAARDALATEVFPALALGAIAAALWTLRAKAPSAALRRGLLAAAAAQVAYAFAYGVSDPLPYFLPALAIVAAIVPAALATFAALRRRGPALASIAAVAILAAALPCDRAARERRTTIEGADAFLREMWDHVPLARGYVIWDDDMSARLQCYQQLEQRHPNVTVVRPRLLMDQGARRRFTLLHGVDPLDGGAPPRDADADAPAVIQRFADQVAEGLNRASADSVVLFLPAEPSLRLLPKHPR